MIIYVLLTFVAIEAGALAALAIYALARRRELATICRIVRAAQGEAVR